MNLKFQVLIIPFILIALQSKSQDVDSLDNLIDREMKLSERIDLLLDFSEDMHSSDPQRAIQYAKKALNIASKNRDEKRILNSYIILSYTHWSLSQFDSAFKYSDLAIELAREQNLLKEEIRALRIKGHIFNDMGLYKKSVECYTRCLYIAEEEHDKLEIGTSYSNIASIYLVEEDIQNALYYFHSALNISKELKDKENIAKGYNNIAAALTSAKEPDLPKAETYFRLALEINKTLNNKRSIGINYLNLGDVLTKQKKFDRVHEYYNLALEQFQSIGDTLYISWVNINLGQYYQIHHEYLKSNNYATYAFSEGEKHGFLRVVIQATHLLRNNFLAMHDTISAFKFDMINDSLNDELDEFEKKSDLAKLMMQYKTEEDDREKGAQQQKKERFYLFLIILIVVLCTFLLIWSSHKRRSRSKKLLQVNDEMQNDIDIKSRELVLSTMSKLKQNEMLMQISDEIALLKEDIADDDIKQKIMQIAQKIRVSSKAQICVEFELRFTHVHEGFFTKLLEQYPELTSNELRLCALLKLNMSTKEMADLTGQSLNAIEMARFRIRKKLGISNTNQNLVGFLSKI